MGTGVTPPLESPETQKILQSDNDRLTVLLSALAGLPAEALAKAGISSRANFMVKPHDRLVLVSFMRYRTSTSSLSPGGLPGVFSTLAGGDI